MNAPGLAAAGTIIACLAAPAHAAPVAPPLYTALTPTGLSGKERIAAKSDSFELGEGSVTASVVRIKSAREEESPTLARERFADWEAGLRFDQDVGKSDNVGIALDGLYDRRRPIASPYPPQGHSSAAMSSAIVWAHKKSWRLAAGYMLCGPFRAATPIERMLQRSSGGMADANGFRLTLDLFDDPGEGEVSPRSIGLDARLQSLAAADLGAPTPRSDARVALSFRTGF